MNAKKYVVKRLIEAEAEIKELRESLEISKSRNCELGEYINVLQKNDARRSNGLRKLLKPLASDRYMAISLDALEQYAHDKYEEWVTILDDLGLEIKAKEEEREF